MALPSKFIIQSGKFVWTTMWHIMMSQLAPRSKSGAYVRPESQFRSTISNAANGNEAYPARRDRYHLIVGYGCPWAHRTLVVRALKGLEDAIPVTIVSPAPSEGGWVFDPPQMGYRSLKDLYQQARPGYSGRATVPVLWDSETKTIVNNESADIILMLNSALNEFATHPDLDLYPEASREAIDAWNEKIYPSVNNGVYRCGFAQSQEAYEQACGELFATLDEIDAVLQTNRYLCGDRITLADVRLFPTLFRFDAVYHGLFKCSRRRIQDYPHLANYLRDLYQLPGVAETSNLEAVKRDYYSSLFPLNPGGIVPLTPEFDLLQPHDRHTLSQTVLPS